MESNPLLSILIPTYNGASKFLDSVLEYLVKGISLCDTSDIEVIVSNNSSTDNTEEILSKYDKYPFIKHYTNKENIGFARNIILLTDTYARGEYGWVIGDDDIVKPDFFAFIIPILKEKRFDYLSLGYQEIRKASEIEFFDNVQYSFAPSSFASSLEHNDSSLGTFMSSAIFRVSTFQKVSKDCITKKFDTFQSIFPNGYVNAAAFYDKKCGYITGMAVYPIVHSKDWASSDNSYMIYTRILPEFYNYILSLGVNKKDLVRTYNNILCNGLWTGYRRLTKFKKVDGSFLHVICESFSHPYSHILLFKLLGEKIFMRK